MRKLNFKIFGKTFEIGIKNEALPPLSSDSAWTNYLKGAGYGVSSDTALKIAVVIRCADVVAKTMASLGCNLYKRTSNGWTEDDGNLLYMLFKSMPNRETTAYSFWHMYLMNLMLTSGAYAKIVRDQNGFIQEVWNIPTCNVTPRRNTVTGERYIDVFYNSESHTGIMGEKIYEADFLHTPGLRFNNEEQSEDFIRIAGEVLGLTMSLNSYAKEFFDNGSNMGGFISYPNGINEVAFNKFKEDWKKAYQGVTNSHKWALLEGGFTATKFDSNPEQAQALDSRKFQVIETCRIMGVPPHKVFQLDGVNYNSIEQLNIEYCQETISPMDTRISQTLNKDILTAKQRKNYKYKFNQNTLLRGDTATRTTFYNQMRQNGVMSANDIRRLEDMPTISSVDGGDALLVNGNFISLKNAEQNLPKSMQKGETK